MVDEVISLADFFVERSLTYLERERKGKEKSSARYSKWHIPFLKRAFQHQVRPSPTYIRAPNWHTKAYHYKRRTGVVAR